MADEMVNDNIHILFILLLRFGDSLFISAMKEREKRWSGIAEC